MKLIIAGTRTFYIDSTFIIDQLNFFSLWPTQLVLGGASGVDEAGLNYAKNDNISYKIFKADWDKHGKAAGPIRNKQMAEYADSLLLIWDGESKGSKNMKEEMLKLNKPIYEVVLKHS